MRITSLTRRSEKCHAALIPKRGFTMVELLATLAIIGLLLALLLPAVQSARESARRIQCRNNLKQIGLAIHNYESVHQMWPAALSRGLSFHVGLLPYIDQPTLYQAVDDSRDLWEAADAIRGTEVSTYLCPSDPKPAVHAFPNGLRIAATSYLGNHGTGLLHGGLNGVFRHLAPWRPDIYEDGPIRSADITDGLSQTAAVAEVLHSVGVAPGERLRTTWQTPRSYTVGEFDQFRSDCRNVPEDPVAAGWRGTSIFHGSKWVQGGLGVSTYTHSLSPQNPSCTNRGGVPDGIYSAGSSHIGTVHVLHADGHVAPVAWQVDELVWMNLGSRFSAP